MEASSSSIADCDMDKDLQELLEVFGSEFSLKDVTCVYFQSKQDKNLAAEFLCSLHGRNYENAAPAKLNSESDGTSIISSAFPSGILLENASDGEKRIKEQKSKNYPASLGSVSSVIGKEYAKTKPLKNEVIKVHKPLILESKDFPVSELWSEKNPSNSTMRNEPAQTDIEEFLFKMLGEGFQLDMSVIQEVLGICGYDMQKSIDKLLDLSVASIDMGEDHGMNVEESIGKCSDQELVSLQEQMQRLDSTQSDGAGLMERNLTGSPEREKDRIGLQKELLQALFDVPNRCEDAPKKTGLVRAVKKPKTFCKPVFDLPKDATKEDKPSAAELHAVTGGEDADNSYKVLRTAVKEYWLTMKEYYKAAVDAFVKGDHARANKLLEQGQFFNNKAREADDKSCQKLVETRDGEVMSLKLHGLEPKEALSLLRLHLTSISGISSIKYLRVIMGNNDEDGKEARTRRLILKQLEKESIEWNDENNGKTILIQVDAIDPKRLSFVKKRVPGDQVKSRTKPGNLGYYF